MILGESQMKSVNIDTGLKINIIKEIRKEIKETINSERDPQQKMQDITEIIEKLLMIISELMNNKRDWVEVQFFASAMAFEMLDGAKSMDELVKKFLSS